MSAARKLLLGFGIAIIATLFFLASRPPSEAEIEYRSPTPAGSAPAVDMRSHAAVERDPALDPAGLAGDRRPPPAE